MSIGFIECVSLGGNVKDMFGYLEPLHEAGYTVNAYMTMPAYYPLSFKELYDKWETTIPLECFHHTERASLSEMSKFSLEKDSLRIAGAPSLIKIPDKPDCQMSKIIFPFFEQLPRREGISYFTVSKSLEELLSVPFIPRPIDYSIFKKNIKETPKYDITDAMVCHEKKKLEVFNELALNYKVKIAMAILAEWQEELISKYPNIDYIKNASKSEVAKLMGDSKICLHPSLSEQASVTIDEALCSGCYCLAKDTISYQEQINYPQWGDIIGNNLNEQIERVLDSESSTLRSLRAGEAFKAKDRRFIKDKWLNTIRQELRRVE